jgi:hypothetical protein
MPQSCGPDWEPDRASASGLTAAAAKAAVLAGAAHAATPGAP